MSKVILLFLFFSCSHTYEIGLKKHFFASKPRKVIWIQIAGFDINHLALLKLTNWAPESKNLLERSTCLGQAWDYNLYKLKPGYFEVMNDQVTGQPISKGSCKDLSSKTYWGELKDQNDFDTFYIQDGKNPSLDLLSCSEFALWGGASTTILRDKVSKEKKKRLLSFHYSEVEPLKEAKVYYDRSCSTGECYNSLLQTTSSLLKRNFKSSSKFVYHIQNFSYLNLLKKRKYKKAARVLLDIEQTVEYLRSNYSEKETLILVTGALGEPFKFPNTGNKWKEFEVSNKKIVQNSSLFSTVLSYGARAENFCGIYESKSMFQRIFTSRKKLKIDIGP